MRFIADDGKIFETKSECLEHEKVLDEKKKAKEKLEAEKKNRWEEVVAAYKTYEDLRGKYFKDYKTYPVDENDFTAFLNDWFGI